MRKREKKRLDGDWKVSGVVSPRELANNANPEENLGNWVTIWTASPDKTTIEMLAWFQWTLSERSYTTRVPGPDI
ncbi:hypothetical protein PDE_00225 [Penicillium oxalicum 114-2]|uniref:Uncharacterized protein n=1 Tax=Penicillium oxalicum (strain 114-2 / CGMCC 5302) TaxID=933388 RepID=S8ATZ3_PENO1|nr:hypothetical protein PDE_00225 [Penicillium oxalicum 114-2]